MNELDQWDFTALRQATMKYQKLTQEKLGSVDHKRDMRIELHKAEAEVEKKSLLLEAVKQEMMNIKLYLNSLPK